MIKKICLDEETGKCIVFDEIIAPRGIGKSKKANEVIIYMFNANKRPDLFEKYMNELPERK